jgi:hypothetical protein
VAGELASQETATGQHSRNLDNSICSRSAAPLRVSVRVVVSSSALRKSRRVLLPQSDFQLHSVTSTFLSDYLASLTCSAEARHVKACHVMSSAPLYYARNLVPRPDLLLPVYTLSLLGHHNVMYT